VQQQTGQFVALDEQGREYVVDVYTTFADVQTVGDPHAAPIPTLQELRTGRSGVIRLSKGEYQIAATGARLRSDSPDAP